jgi:hypothetical protein
MALSVHLLRTALPASLSAAGRLLVLASFGAAVFIACAWLVDRKTMARAFDFASSAVRRVRRDPVPSQGTAQTARSAS